MKERQIFCCGSSVWTRAIGWFQIITSSLLAISLMLIVADPTSDADIVRFPSGNKSSHLPANDSIEIVLYSAAWFIFLCQLILTLTDCLMGFVLLYGSIKQNTRFMYYWVLYTFCGIGIWGALTLAECFTVHGMASIVSEIISIVVGVAIQGFCLWVVIIHKDEVEYAAKAVAASANTETAWGWSII